MSATVGYVLPEFPRYSETFILNELVALKERGHPARIFCMRGDEDQLASVPSDLRPLVTVISPPDRNLALDVNTIVDMLERVPDRFRDQFNRVLEKEAARTDSNRAKRANAVWNFFCAVRIAHLAAEENIGHLHAHYANSSGLIAEQVKKLSGIGFSFTGHAKDIFTLKPESLARLLKNARFAIGCSEAGCNHMREANPDAANRIHLVHHGLNIARWNAALAEKHLNASARVIAVGRLTPKKGFIHLVRAISALKRRGVDLPCEIIGEGRERESLEAEAASLGVAGHVCLPGRCEQTEIRARFESAPIFAMPSVILETNNQDGIANALLEAMASGLALVASDIPAFREVVQSGTNGLLVPPGDSDALADALQALAQDSGLRSRLGAAARASIEHLTCDRAAEQIRDLFERYASHE